MDDDPLTSPSFPAINTSDSRSYRTRSGNGSYGDRSRGYPAGPDRSASAPNGHPVQPAASGNPYGSYVSAPRYPEPASAHLDPAAYGTGYAAGQQAVAAANWYSSTDGGPAIDGYLPSGNNGYGHQPPAYQGGQPALPGGYGQPGHLAGQYEHGGYRGPDGSYAPDGYEAYPGYGGAPR
jgi:hypothetical protein